MKILGTQTAGYREPDIDFQFEVPDGSHLHFDSNQSTLTVKDKSGSVLLAIKQVKFYALAEIATTWIKPESKLVEELKAQVTLLEDKLAFHQEVNGA